MTLSTGIASVITAVWSITYLYDMFGPADYQPSAAITPLMLTVATFAFGGGLLSNRHKREPNNE